MIDTGVIHQGDAVGVLDDLPESSVHMAMCSPPYFGLRDYGVDGQIGLEDSLEEYIAEIVDVGRSLRRVLRDDGSWWLNLGDSYSQSGKSNHDKSGTAPDGQGHSRGHDAGAFGAKNKMLVPHRTAIALQQDEWVVRNDVVWAKPNPMPESVTDRLSTTFEFVFHLTPQPDYWYDLDAIREPYAESSDERYQYGYDPERPSAEPTDNPVTTAEEIDPNPAGKNPGDVFEVTTKPFPEAHFAVYPPELCEKPIRASCPPKVCVECGAPYERDVEVGGHRGRVEKSEIDALSQTKNDSETWSGRIGEGREREFKGWLQTCDCDTDEIEPGIVLDPFAGAGTTLLVAKRLGRRFVGIELNEEYVAMGQKRVGIDVDHPEFLTDDGQETLPTEATD